MSLRDGTKKYKRDSNLVEEGMMEVEVGSDGLVDPMVIASGKKLNKLV